MQRAITIILVLILFAIGVNVVANGFALPGMPYKVPADSTMAAVLVGSLAGVLVLTVIAGGGLAFIFNLIGSLLEKDKPGSPSSSAPSGTPVPPYVPSYSYKKIPENVETRSWIIYSVIGLALLAFISSKQIMQLVQTASSFDVTTLAIGGGSVVGIVVVTIALGAGLAFWFYRTAQEQALTAKEGPMWPSAEMQALEEKLKSPEQFLPKNMTFFDKALIGFNVFLAVVILGVIAAWVVPGMVQVAAVDEAVKPTVAPKPTQPAVPVAIGPSADLKKEFAALPKGDAASGQKLFTTLVPPCSSCHMVTGDQVLVGPSLAGVATRASKRKAGYDTEIYIYESITSPSAYLVSGFQDGLMPQTFKETLKQQEISDLIAYLATLK